VEVTRLPVDMDAAAGSPNGGASAPAPARDAGSN
jgi:hypothetical protein